MTYRVEIKPSVLKALRKFPSKVQRAVVDALDSLGTDPRPPGCKALAGLRDGYRIRVGDYRVVYQIKDRVLVVLVLAAGPRGDVYRVLKTLK